MRDLTGSWEGLFENIYGAFGVALGIIGLLTGLAFLLFPEASENHDWCYFALLVFAFPALFLGVARISERARFLFLLAAPVFAGVVFFDGALQFASGLLAKFEMAPSLHSLTTTPLYLLALSVRLIYGVGNFYLILRFTRWIAGLAKVATGGPAGLLCLSLVYCLLLLSDHDKPYFWLHQRLGSTYPILALLLWYCWKIFKHPMQAGESSFDSVDGVWLLLFLSLGRTILQGVDFSTYLHWSFYLGPIDSIRHGGHLLRDVPSQYGLLSLWLPAALPFTPGNSFLVVFFGLMFAQAVVTYRLFRGYFESRFLPGLLTLACTFFIGGNRESMEVLALPSTSSYRFFWAFALVFVLMRPGGRRAVQNFGIGFLFCVGCLWSGESAFYCIAILSAALVAEFLLILSSTSRTRLLDWILSSTIPLALSIGAIEIYYRTILKISPDWFAFVEFPLAYQGGFGALPIYFGGAVNGMAALLAISAVMLTYGVFVRREANSGGAFGAWGFLLATFTYYISRSTPSNIANLLGYWIPVVFLIFSRIKLGPENRLRLQPVVHVITLMTLLIAFAHGHLLPGRVKKFLTLPNHSSVEFAFDLGTENRSRAEEILLRQKRSIPLFDLTNVVPCYVLPGLEYRPFYPFYPVLEFSVLDPARQTEYLERSIERQPEPTLQVLRDTSGANYFPKLPAVIDAFLAHHYRKVSADLIGKFTLEIYQRRGEAIP